MPSPAKKLSAWRKVSESAKEPDSKMQAFISSSKEERLADAQSAYSQAMVLAQSTWAKGDLQECELQLRVAALHMPQSDAVQRFRAKVHAKLGQLDDALEAASKAVLHDPSNPQNHHTFAVACQRNQKLVEAGPAFLTSMSRGLPGTSDDVGFRGYLDTIMRQRRYFEEQRPPHRKRAGAQSLALARDPARSSIFDPDKIFDDGGKIGDGPKPEAPMLSFVKADESSVSVCWQPASTTYPWDGKEEEREGLAVMAYEVQAASHHVAWKGTEFFDGFLDFETVYKGEPFMLETTVNGLFEDNRVRLRIRACGEYGPGEWNELEMRTLPVPAKQAAPLPLPRLWLQLDVADLVPLHVFEAACQPKHFFTELARVFTPNVRKIRRVFFGWGRATAVGNKSSKAGELSQVQFLRMCKEVGLCKDSSVYGQRAARRSGAKLLQLVDIDRIFQRANIDASEKDGAKGWKDHGLGLSRAKIAEMAITVLDELTASGWLVESDPGEAALREKLEPLFKKADLDGSGAVSTSEVEQMAIKLKIDIKPAELKKLIAEADADGSGELDFEEIVNVLMAKSREEKKAKSKPKEEVIGVMPKKGITLADIFKVEDEEEGDGGAASMVLHEFIHALIRLAWECYPIAGAGIGTRLSALLDRALFPNSMHILEPDDPMESELSSKRVQAITSYYSDQLLDIFNVFAASDMSLAAQAASDSMSFPELLFMFKMSELIDGHLTVARLTEIFAQVNAQADDEGEKDDDGDELSFSEFKMMVCRAANAKIPPEVRGDPPEPFEFVWQSFLQIIFLPKMKKVIKDMRKGLIKKTLK